jgi:DNA modification methylase
MSVKPEPMLKHFFEMFVDESTIFLDPTCGSGSSVRAAESLGAAHVLGLERDPEFHESASRALRSARLMRRGK